MIVYAHKEVMTLQVTLKAARVNAGMTRKTAALSLGISVDTLANWERGRSFPTVPQIQRIESLYGVPYDELIFLSKSTL